MMKKKEWIKCGVAAFLCLMATGCSKESGLSGDEEFTENFRTFVMGGKAIDTHQTWSTVVSVPVKIIVDFGNTADYTVYIFQTPPLYDTKALYIGMAKVKSGTSKTIYVTKPANTGLFYAACYDSDGHAVCRPFPISTTDTELTFTGKIPDTTTNIIPIGGNRWSITEKEIPNLTHYITGTLPEVTDVMDQANGEAMHMRLSSDYTGFIPNLALYEGQSLYVTSQWTLSMNQQISNGNVLIIGDGGEVVIPKDYKLTTKSLGSNSKSGAIYVLPGGKISGEGIVEFTDNESEYHYNGGTIMVNNLLLSGGLLYNIGTIGNPIITTTSITSSIDANGQNGNLINRGYTYLTQFNGNNLAIQNGGYLKVNGPLQLNSSSLMDDGSYTECDALTLNGSSNGDKVLYMGNAAYLNCLGDVSINNFGVWGPTGDNYQSNAIFKISGCSYCTTTDGQPGTYMLDHVELITPQKFPTVFDNGAMNIWDSSIKGIGTGKLQTSFSGFYNLYMLYHWFNGYEGRILNTENYQWTTDNNDKNNFEWNKELAPHASGVESLRQTCLYSTSPSYTYTGIARFRKESVTTPSNNCVYYAFETLEDKTKDYDFNDLVLRVNTPIDNGDNTYTSTVQIMCVGNTIKTNVLYNNEVFGNEIHATIGTAVTTPINVTDVPRVFRKFGTITFNAADNRIDQLPFSIQTEDTNGKVTLLKPDVRSGEAPLFIVINGDVRSRWFWPIEGTNIGIAYPQFSNWGANMQSNVDWYDSTNAAVNRTVVWE